MKQKKPKPSETKWITLEEFAAMLGITMPKKKKNEKSNK